MKWLGLLGIVLAAGAVACGGDVSSGGSGGGGGGAGGGHGFPSSSSGLFKDACQEAVDHVVECIPSASGTTSGNVECTGVIECQAKCVSAASCDAIQGNDPMSQDFMTYVKCLTDCNSAG